MLFILTQGPKIYVFLAIFHLTADLLVFVNNILGLLITKPDILFFLFERG